MEKQKSKSRGAYINEYRKGKYDRLQFTTLPVGFSYQFKLQAQCRHMSIAKYLVFLTNRDGLEILREQTEYGISSENC